MSLPQKIAIGDPLQGLPQGLGGYVLADQSTKSGLRSTSPIPWLGILHRIQTNLLSGFATITKLLNDHAEYFYSIEGGNIGCQVG